MSGKSPTSTWNLLGPILAQASPFPSEQPAAQDPLLYLRADPEQVIASAGEPGMVPKAGSDIKLPSAPKARQSTAAISVRPNEPMDFAAQAELLHQKAIEDKASQVESYKDELKQLGEKPSGWSTWDMTPLAGIVDQWTGSNLARTYKAPTHTKDWEQKKALLQDALSRSQGSYTDDLKNYLKMKAAEKEHAEELDLRRQLAQQKQASTQGQPKELSQATVLKVNEGNAIPAMLDDIDSTINNNTGSFDPIRGKFSTWNPYNEKANTIDAQMRTASQAFGKYMEGGVLRKEDEEKYRKMFPSLSDTPAVAKNKLQIVRKLLIERQNSDVNALKAQGFGVQGLENGMAIPTVPSVLNNHAGKVKIRHEGKVLMIPEADLADALKDGAERL